ncbi:hypothetical protein HF086_008492 [Spodoptera exigua]|uniref:Uncharacterized protein n=1 Tax=Spodoptera exigua TaxID=7107 RepID=A0A922M991_SPOEX|nr:hypothetical protein HF086_008492 [Spodoptera exigua]
MGSARGSERRPEVREEAGRLQRIPTQEKEMASQRMAQGISNESLDFSSECSSDDSPFTRKKEQSPELQSCYTCSPISFSTPIDKEKEYNPPKPKIGDGHFNDKLLNNHKSLCSMNCVARFTVDELQRKKSPNISEGSTEGEKQIHSTDLDISSTKTTDTALADAEKTKRETSPFRYSESKQPLLTDNKVEPTAAYYFFTRNKSRSSIINTQMRKSKKSTNLVKYRNFIDEPTLRRPLSKSMLLGRYKNKTKTEKKSDIEKLDNSEKSTDRAVACDTVQTESNEVQASSIENKSLQDAMTTSDYDNITERLMVSIFEKAKNTTVTDVQLYIQQVVKDLYDIKFQEVHPVKALFRSLLEYWLKNTKVEPIKTAMRHSRSIDRQSNKYFTRDENLSSVYIGRVSKQTQFHGLSEMLFQYKKKPNTAKPVPKPPDRPPSSPSPRRDTESFEKERRIQELERLLKNTVYMCETTRSNQQKDIKITKTLIDNIGKLPPKTEEDSPTGLNKDNSNSSTEKIQETLNHLLSDTSISPDVAKEFFSAYLDILLKEDFRSLSETSSPSSEHSVASKGSKELSCQVEAEAVTKTASKSVTTLKDTQVTQPKSSDAFKPIDPGQLYLKEVLDRITTIFSKVKKMEDTTWTNEKSHENVKGDFKELEHKDELGRPDKEYPGKKLIYENYDENSVVIDLSKYDLQHISMFNDPALEGVMSISIKLKEKPPTMADNKHAHLSLQFADSNSLKKEEVQKELKQNWLSYIQSTNSNEIFEKRSKSPDAYADFAKKFDLKPYSSSSDATSKAYKVVHESEHSLDLSFKNSFLRGLDPKQSFDNEDTSCYMMSFKKEPTKFQPKKRVRLKDYNGISKRRSPCRSPTRQPDLSVFEQPAPRVIDEKFILLLLENLSLLSKNIPSLHKDINSLFVKLRKKHEKILKNCGNVYGLSLLGKIYNEDSECGACRKDASTQWDVVTCYPLSEEVSITEKAINTCSHTKIRKNVKDACTSAIDLKLVLNCEVQTKSEGEKTLYCFERGPPSLGDTSLTENLVKVHSIHRIKLTEMDKKTAEHSTSCPKSVHKIATECSMTALIKRVLDPEGRLNTTTNPTSREHMIKKKKISSKLRQDLIKEITLLSPSFKVSTQSQTDRRLLRFVREKWIEKDFKVYQLFYSKNSIASSLVIISPSFHLRRGSPSDRPIRDHLQLGLRVKHHTLEYEKYPSSPVQTIHIQFSNEN